MAITRQCDICKRTRDEMKGAPIYEFTENHMFAFRQKTNQFDICADCMNFIKEQMRKKETNE